MSAQHHLPPRLGYLMLVISLVGLVLAGCGGGSSTDPTTTTVPTTTTTVVSTAVTGTSTCTVVDDGLWLGPTLPSSGLPGSAQRGYKLDCDDVVSDDRASGSNEVVVSCDFAVDGESTVGDCWGTTAKTNAGGVWDGTLMGTTTWSTAEPGHVHVMEIAFKGAGDYEGLEYASVVEGIDFPWTINGTIQPAAAGAAAERVVVTGRTGAATTETDEGTVDDGVAASDARVEGTTAYAIECDLTEDGDTTVGECSGPISLTNDDGTWEGSCRGTTTWSVTDPGHFHRIDCSYLGTGGYAGLRYSQYLEGIDMPWSIIGLIEPVA